MNSARIKINLWSFTHIHILYAQQRSAIMLWLNTIEKLSSKFVKTLNLHFDFYILYRNINIFLLVFISVLYFI